MTSSRRPSCPGFGLARVAGLIAVSAGVTLLASVPPVGALRTAGPCDPSSTTEFRGVSGSCVSAARDVTRDTADEGDELSPRPTAAVLVDGAVIHVRDATFRTQDTSVDGCLTQTRRHAALRAPPGFDSDPSDDTDDDDGNDGDALAPAHVTLNDGASHTALTTVLIAATVMATPHASFLRGPPLS